MELWKLWEENHQEGENIDHKLSSVVLVELKGAKEPEEERELREGRRGKQRLRTR